MSEVSRNLAREIARRTSAEVCFDEGSRAAYATDSSNYRLVPIGVVVPRTVEDVVTTMEVCRQYRAPVLARGGGTSLAGQCCNVAVVLDCSKYLNQVLEIDPERRLARVEPGVVLDTLRDRAERHGLTFAPDPATHSRCTLGGMIGNNSCGVHSVMAGKTDDNVHELDVVTYDGLRLRVGPTSEEELAGIVAAGGRRGEIYGRLRALRDRYADLVRSRFPNIPRRVSGYNLPWLLPEHGFHLARALVGSESTCAFVLGATVHLVHSPPHRTLLVLGYPDVFSAADDVPFLLESRPVGLEGFDSVLVEAVKRVGLHPQGVRRLPPGAGWLMVEFGGETRQEANERAESLVAALRRRGRPVQAALFDDPKEALAVWKVRESALGAMAVVPGRPRTWEGWEDAAVAPECLGGYLREFMALVGRHQLFCALYGHFGDGCVHTRISFDFDSAAGIARFRRFVEEAAEIVLRYGGSFSGEHGDGQARGELLPKMFGPELMQAFREFKAIWDPQGRMNPGKLLDARPLDVDLRHAAVLRPPPFAPYLRFPEEEHGFVDTTRRCVGVGECRRLSGGTMCPSYKATGDERHSTRGRSRLLFEMAAGEVLQDGWRSQAVKEALDLCLACKGCKGDCPVHVDVASYKAEFLSHYYERRLRPPVAYAVGLVHWGARVASLAPGLANALTQGPLAPAIKAILGIAPRRRLPKLAARSFSRDFRQHAPAATARLKDVLLWVDTFNNHFHPEVLWAAVQALTALGYRVRIPEAPLCCGRPLYDWGFLGVAKALLLQTMETLARDIDAGTPIVGLEPSCVAVFRDELPNLFPDDAVARRLSGQVVTLAELLGRDGDLRLPRLARRALVHGHCHQKAVMKMDADAALLLRLGLDFRVLDSGCCGMAGAFGFLKLNYEVSMKVGESVLLPAVRGAAPDDLVIADGFSCREQIAQSTDRRALHLAEVLELALREVH